MFLRVKASVALGVVESGVNTSKLDNPHAMFTRLLGA